jgi:hypothetical protein
MTHALLRSLIRETLLTEEVYGAQAVVYHGTVSDPRALISALLNDEFVPGKGKGAMYGKGLYTVYDLAAARTGDGFYGDHVIKLKLNLYGYIIFDPDVALKVYKAPLSIVEQAQDVGADEDIIERLRGLKIDKSEFSSNAALSASQFLKGRVKGIVYTGANDGRCALVYDPTTAVPIAWKNVRDASWTPVDRSSIRPALRRSASGAWEEEKYDLEITRMVKGLANLPIDQRVVKGDLNLEKTSITSLPAGLNVSGYLSLINTPIRSLPKGLKVGEDLLLGGSSVTALPKDIQAGSINVGRSRISELPDNFNVVGDIFIGNSITSLPRGLRVAGTLGLNDLIKTIPEDLWVGKNLYLHRAPITSFPDSVHVGGFIKVGFSGDKSIFPEHLRSKLK